MLTLDVVEDNLLKLKDRLNERKGEQKVLTSRLVSLTKSSQSITNLHKELEESKQLLLSTVQYAREEAKDILEGLVTKALRYLLQDDTITFLIEINDLKNRTECDFYVVEDGQKRNPLNCSGGGVADIIATVLRFSLIQAHNQIKIEDDEYNQDVDNLSPIILDEPFKHLSQGKVEGAGEFLRKIYESLDRQLVIVTHDSMLKKYGDKTFTVKKVNNISLVNEED